MKLIAIFFVIVGTAFAATPLVTVYERLNGQPERLVFLRMRHDVKMMFGVRETGTGFGFQGKSAGFGEKPAQRIQLTVANRREVVQSQWKTCYPDQSFSMNVYVEKIDCDGLRRQCDVIFGPLLGGGSALDVPFTGSARAFKISAKSLAVALTGATLVSPLAVYGRAQVGDLACTSTTEAGTCALEMNWDESPVPATYNPPAACQ